MRLEDKKLKLGPSTDSSSKFELKFGLEVYKFKARALSSLFPSPIKYLFYKIVGLNNSSSIFLGSKKKARARPKLIIKTRARLGLDNFSLAPL